MLIDTCITKPALYRVTKEYTFQRRVNITSYFKVLWVSLDLG